MLLVYVSKATGVVYALEKHFYVQLGGGGSNK